MKQIIIASILPLTLLLTACQNVAPVIQDNGQRTAPCIDGGPDSVAQKFYDAHISAPFTGLPSSQKLVELRPYLSDMLYQMLNQASIENAGGTNVSGDIFVSNPAGASSADVSSASSILNSDAKNIPLRVTFNRSQDGKAESSWKDEILMIREGQCWVVDDIRYIGPTDASRSGTLRQSLEKY